MSRIMAGASDKIATGVCIVVLLIAMTALLLLTDVEAAHDGGRNPRKDVSTPACCTVLA